MLGAVVKRRRHRAASAGATLSGVVDVIIVDVPILVVVLFLGHPHEVHGPSGVGLGLERRGRGRGDGGEFGEEGFEAAHRWSDSHGVV